MPCVGVRPHVSSQKTTFTSRHILRTELHKKASEANLIVVRLIISPLLALLYSKTKINTNSFPQKCLVVKKLITKINLTKIYKLTTYFEQSSSSQANSCSASHYILLVHNSRQFYHILR
jgi:hypothetical protein